MNLKYRINLFKKSLVEKYPYLNKFLKINYGLLEDEKDDRDYVMGASNDKINWKVIKEDGNWLPEAKKMINETQRSGRLETMNCTRFALNNVKEMIHLAKWNEAVNYSDRFPGKLQGTTQNGNSMKTQLECDRKYGCVKEKVWCWDKEKFNWNEYYKLPSQDILAKGEVWTKEYKFGYDGVWANKSMIKEALKYSPLYVGGYAWYRKGELYYSMGNPNHCFTVIAYDKAIAYDSYAPYIKKLADDFKLYYIKRIYLEKRDNEYNLQELTNLKNRGLDYIMRVQGAGEIYKIDGDTLKYISPKEWNDINVILTEQQRKLVGISEEFYSKLIE